jgi:hypothetical protein
MTVLRGILLHTGHRQLRKRQLICGGQRALWLTCCKTSIKRLLCASRLMPGIPSPRIALSLNWAKALLASIDPELAARVACIIVSMAAADAESGSSDDPDRMSDSRACTRNPSSTLTGTSLGVLAQCVRLYGLDWWWMGNSLPLLLLRRWHRGSSSSWGIL